MDRIELIARAIAKASGFHPDTPACLGEPCRVRGGFIPHDTAPLWTFYREEALAVSNALEAVGLPEAYRVAARTDRRHDFNLIAPGSITGG